MSRITAGTFRGMRLSVPAQIRATEEKVRQSLFNILGSFVEGARVLDGFAGSGALGLEALSRGAREVVFVEADPASLQALRRNLDALASRDIEGSWNLIRGNVLHQLTKLAKSGPFDVVLLDPPYGGSWGKKALNVSAACAILAPAGILCLEHARQTDLPATVGSLARWKQHRYGDTVLSFYRPQTPEHAHTSPLPRDL